MKSLAQVKIIGEGYGGDYTTGLTMYGSNTMHGFEESVSESNEELTVLKRQDGPELRIFHKKSSGSDATIVETEFRNGSSEPVTLEMLSSLVLKDIKADRIHRLLSFWSAEGRLKTEEIVSLDLERSWSGHGKRVEKFGNVGSMPVRRFFPFLALEDSRNHVFTGVQLYAPASWQMEILSEQEGSVTITGGIADRDFGHWTKTVKPGERYLAPRAILATGSTLEEVCDKLVKAQEPKTSPVDDHMGIVFNEYCTTWGNPNIDNLKKLADAIADKGIQYLVMDSGWYGKCGDGSEWWECRGDWSINKTRFPNGLKELTDYVRAKGMIPGIWFEPEVCRDQSEIYYETDHLLKRDGVPLCVCGTRFPDMEDPWVQDFMYRNVIKTLKDNDFGYVKIDYNDAIGVGVDGPEGPGENLWNKIRETKKFFERMREEIPELVIENCSSGGHRLEPSFMELCSQASFSDAHEAKCLPIIAANVQRVIRREQRQIWAVMRLEDDDNLFFYFLCCTFLGRLGLSGDVYDLCDHQWE
ncbi:MAG: alpha-galactosidase, partial [Lachnospiraceae bacterium]|nr:alpha-galactosidase [Lachnospiraceae bacterium]